MTAGLVSSPEYFALQGGTNQGFVGALYQDVLGRPAGPAEETSWLQALANGLARSVVAGGFLTSTEYQDDVVQGYYQQFLERPADAGSLASWVGGLAAGLLDPTVLAAILGSPEGFNEQRTEQLLPASLGTGALLEGPSAGGDADIVVTGKAWTATSNAPWLHTSSHGSGNGLAKFTFDANPGATRTGTLTIAGQTLTVTQAGSGYLAANPVTTLASGVFPFGVAVDAVGNVYFADQFGNAVREWSASTQQVSTLVSTGLNMPQYVAVDAAGNVYIADTGNNAIKEWIASTHQVVTLVSSGLRQPYGVAVDTAGNVYFADFRNEAVKEWNASTKQVSTLAFSGGPYGVAVDAAGNVYFTSVNILQEWSASTKQVYTLVSSGLSTQPYGVAVDAAGNVYIADQNNAAVYEWSASAQQVSPLVSSGLSSPEGVAVDAAGNVYIGDLGDNAIKERVKAYVPGGAVSEGPGAGSDALAPVLPATQSLTGVFAPTSDQDWLTIGPIANGVIHFSFTANMGGARTGHITVLGQSVAVTQAAAPPRLGTSALLEGPLAGGDTDIVVTSGVWTATSNASWLHTSSSGTGNGLATFTFDANPGATRTGTLTIAGLTLTVTQAGNTYLPANPVTTLVSSGLSVPEGVAVDAAGNVYIADTFGSAIDEWDASLQLLGTLVSSGLLFPEGVAVDTLGNVYIADTNNSAIKEWNASTRQVSTLVSSGLSGPTAVAVDAAGNVYIADTNNNALKEWNAATGQVSTLVSSGLSGPMGVAVDAAGNVYVADTFDSAIKEWNASTGQVSTLVSSGLNAPGGVAVDGSGNVYISDNSGLKEWSASTGQVSTLVSSGLRGPFGLAVDAAGNVYFADVGNKVIKERVTAYVSAGAVNEVSAAGSDALLAVLPTTQSLTGLFAPTSDADWLTIGATANGVVHFSFTANTGPARLAHITVLGQSITVTQAAP